MKVEETTREIPPPKPKRQVLTVEDDELHPLTRAYPVGAEEPPPLPGRAPGAMRVEATFTVRDEELQPITRAQWLQKKPQRSGRRARKAPPVKLAG
jgi:hypothetical protein